MQEIKSHVNKYLKRKTMEKEISGVDRLRGCLPFIVLICFIVGILGANMIGAGENSSAGIWNNIFIEKFKYTPIYPDDLFYYILAQRIPVLCLLILLLIGNWGTFAGMFFLSWQGFAAGFLMATAVTGYGVKGILLTVVSAFPQYIVYIPLYIAYVYIAFYRKEVRKNSGNGKELEKKQEITFLILVILLLFLLYVTGIFMESYINPYCLKNFLKIF